jgi:hypothetical protein
MATQAPGVRLLVVVLILALLGCGREASPPPPSAPRPPDPTLRELVRRYDREVIEVLKRFPERRLGPEDRDAIARGTTLNAPASADDIEALEKRIGKPLPPSYRAFLMASDGMHFHGALNQVRMLRANEVVPLTEQAYPGLLRVWAPMADVAIPLDPLAGGPLPGAALRRAWVISTDVDTDMYMILPDLATPDGEWPVWFYGYKNPGVIGYPSFRAMLERERPRGLRSLEQQRALPI